MNKFTFSYPTKVYFGEGSAEQAFETELGKVGETVMVAYGGGSVKKNGIYNEMKDLLEQAGKKVVDFSGIMSNPTYTKVQEGAALAIMRNTVVNMRRLLKNINDMQARSNLMWDSAMAENGILKCGRLTDFQAHQIEHQLGAYTDCNHGQGLAVIHPVYYRHIVKDAPEKFARFAEVVFGADTCNIIKCNPRQLNREEIYQILMECL